MKTCCNCKQIKPDKDFNKHRHTSDNLQPWCKKCNMAATREKITGCTSEMYDKLFEKQKGCCAICGKHNKDLKRNLAADHCHSTKEVRGLLCGSCNMGLGYFKDSSELLSIAIKYLTGEHYESRDSRKEY